MLTLGLFTINVDEYAYDMIIMVLLVTCKAQYI